MPLLVLSAVDVARVTAKFQPDELVNLMAQVFHRLSTSSKTNGDTAGISQPHRVTVSMDSHAALFMPSRISPLGTAIKVVSVPTANAPPGVKQCGLPASTLVLDEQSGSVKAIVNAGQLTALRNAAGSLLSTRLLLGPEAQPTHLATFGAGAQISAHISLFLAAYPSIRVCTLFNRSMNARFSDLLERLRTAFPQVRFDAKTLPDQSRSGDLQGVVSRANIIITATSSTAPLFPSDCVSPGTHLCLIGSYTPVMHEIDTDLVKRAGKVVVDSTGAALSEAGELISANLGHSDLIELGELILTRRGESDPTSGMDFLWAPDDEGLAETKRHGDVTIFKSVGVGVQDVAIAAAVVTLAGAEHIGVHVDY